MRMRILVAPLVLLLVLLGINWFAWRSSRRLAGQLQRSECAAAAEETGLRILNLLRERNNDLALLAVVWRTRASSASSPSRSAGPN